MGKDKVDPSNVQSVLEQGETALVNLSKVYGSYFKELKKNGFTRDEAFEMVLDYQRLMYGGPPNAI